MVARKRKNKTHHIEILIVACLIFVLGGIFVINNTNFSKGNLITGFVSSDIFTEDLNLVISDSQEYLLSTGKEFKAHSLSINGYAEGDGAIKILFEDYEGNQKLVYSNIKEKKRNGNLITGLAVANSCDITITPGESLGPVSCDLSEDQVLVYGPFSNECVQTCFMDVEFSSDKENKLIFQLSEDTTVEISSISYTVSVTESE